jgi:4-hydroxy-tetrahydrodipicolinate reductase
LLFEEITGKKNKTPAEPLVKGIQQTATASMLGRRRVTLTLEMSAGAQNPRDEIEILGVPPIRVVAPNGIAGDVATPAILVNSAPYLLHAARGVLTVLDIQSPRLCL